jgi:hypothetical protein
MHIDGCRGYGVDEIYGMCSSFWKWVKLQFYPKIKFKNGGFYHGKRI